MSLLLKRKQSLSNDALLDLTDFVVPKLVANMRSVDGGGGDAKRVVTALTAERARKLAADARALMEMCEQHASSVSTASMDALVDDTMRCILAFADHKTLLAFRRTSRRHRSLVDSLPSMCVARMMTRPPPLRKITAHPSLGCVLGNKISVRIHAGVIGDEHREAMRHMPVLRHVMLDRCSLLPYHFTEKRNALRAKFDASLPAVALAIESSNSGIHSMTPNKLDDIELVLGRRVESILFARPRIFGLLDTPRKFKRLAVSTEVLGSTSLFQMCTMVTEQLVVRVDDAHHQHVIRLLTTGAPPAPMAVADSVATAVRRTASSGPALMLEVPNHRAIEWSRDALMTAASSFSHIYVMRFFDFNVFSGVSDTLQPLVDEHPELNEFVSVASDPYWSVNPKFAAFWRAFSAV